MITIHESGLGADKLVIKSHGNGWAYEVHFGEVGSPMCTLWFQCEEAALIREDFGLREQNFPEKASRDLWIETLDPYL